MPIGSFDLSGTNTTLWFDALPIAVFRYDPDADEPFTLLPNVRCDQVDRREGPDPSAARFHYVLDDVAYATWGWPNQLERLWPLDAQGDYVVQSDDRLVVAGLNPDGSFLYLFDGFAQVPQGDIGETSQRIGFAAVGVEARAEDDVYHTILQRDSSNSDDTTGTYDREVQLPCRFNPSDDSVAGTGGFRGNVTSFDFYTATKPPPGEDSQDSEVQVDGYPVFLDPLLSERDEKDGTSILDSWTIFDAALYLLTLENPGDPYVTWPDTPTLQDVLETLAPPGPNSDEVFDPSTATASNCVLRDYDATGKTLPAVLHDLLSYAGVVMCWQVDQDGDGLPETWLKIYRRDAANPTAPKQVYFQRQGTPVNPSTQNISQLHLARDANGIVNAFSTETSARQVEVTVLLAPGFQPAAADKDPSPTTPKPPVAGRGQFLNSNFGPTTSAATRRKYRWYIADECGDGHYNATSEEMDNQPLDLSAVMPDDEDTGAKTYVERYRPGSNRIVALDTDGKPQEATLEILMGTPSGDPQIVTVADGEAGPPENWKLITGGWQLLKDRLGIEVTIEDPENWNGGKTVGDIRGITWQAAPPDGKAFQLRLTTVIEKDVRIDAEADKRISSPTQFTRWRQSDARDHFQYTEISTGSRNYTAAGGDGTDPVVVRDDTDRARTHAEQLRAAHEMPKLAGSITIPFITTYYEVGDRIDTIVGRNIDLVTSVGTDQGEDPTYPWVVGVSWQFEGDRQQTTLQLSDARGEAKNSW